MTELFRRPATDSAPPCSVSLCIATLGSAEALRQVQAGLSVLPTRPDWELILVINGRAVPQLDPDSWNALGWRLSLLHEPRPGKSRALNLAMTAARGDLLVFTDDDVQPEADWLDRFQAAATAHPEIEIFGGRILPRGNVPDWVRRSSNLQQALLSEHDYGGRDRRYPLGHYPIGPNMAVRRRAVDAVGARWIEELGPGTSLPVGDESGFLAQISPAEAGDRYYVASAVVHHTVDGRYFPIARAVRRAFQIGLAAGRLSARHRMTPTAARAVASSLPARVMERVLGLRSIQELACVVSRATGVLVGSRFSTRYRAS